MRGNHLQYPTGFAIANEPWGDCGEFSHSFPVAHSKKVIKYYYSLKVVPLFAFKALDNELELLSRK